MPPSASAPTASKPTTATAAAATKTASNGASSTPVAKAQTAPTKAATGQPLWSFTPVSPGIRIHAANTPMGFDCEMQSVDAAGKLGAWQHVDYIPVAAIRPLLIQAGLLPNR